MMVAVVGVGGRRVQAARALASLARPARARFGDGVLRQFIGLEEDLAALDFLTWNWGVQPSSGLAAWPPHKSMVQLCKGRRRCCQGHAFARAARPCVGSGLTGTKNFVGCGTEDPPPLSPARAAPGVRPIQVCPLLGRWVSSLSLFSFVWGGG